MIPHVEVAVVFVGIVAVGMTRMVAMNAIATALTLVVRDLAAVIDRYRCFRYCAGLHCPGPS